MSLISHSFLPRSMFDMDYWMRPSHLGIGPSTLDIFDPFDEFDRMIGKNLCWLSKPDFIDDLIPSRPRVPHKYRINVDCSGYNPDSIQTTIDTEKNRLIITGKESNVNSDDDYSVREFRKTFKIPQNVESDKMASFITSNGQLVVEIPLKEDEKHRAHGQLSDFFPKIVDDENGNKSVTMNLSIPETIDPNKLSITCKDRDIIIKAEDKKETKDETSSMYYYRRTTLPENTDFNGLKCVFDENQLKISAPLNLALKDSQRSIPIEFEKK